MTQQPMDFEIHPPAIRVVKLYPDLFAPDFEFWLADNAHVWDAFAREADRAYSRGFKHYSARTIIHFLRHYTAMAEVGTGNGWKINNNYSPDMGRLYCLMNPARNGFFEFRVQATSSKRTA